MESRFKNQIALITGSSHGIGRAIAESFLREGARVVLTGRSGEKLSSAEKLLSDACPGGELLTVRADLIHQDGINKCVSEVKSKWGRIDHLVLNLGSGRSVPEAISEQAHWDNIFDVNFNSALRMTRTVLPLMHQQKSGNIVFISSIAGLEAFGAPVDYSTAKAALNAFAKNLSRKVAADGIRVNTVAPGNVFFEGGTWDEKLKQKRGVVEEMLKEKVPMQRFGTPEEVAGAVLFFCSPAASFITGALLAVDGGQTVSV